MGFHTRKLYLSKTKEQIGGGGEGGSQSTIILSNILKNIQTTHVTDNVDWETKSVTGQTHNTNSILLEHISDSETRNSSVQLGPDY